MKLNTHIQHQEKQSKRQLTVRFTSWQVRKIEELSENTDVSLAEACRRIVSKGLRREKAL